MKPTAFPAYTVPLAAVLAALVGCATAPPAKDAAGYPVTAKARPLSNNDKAFAAREVANYVCRIEPCAARYIAAIPRAISSSMCFETVTNLDGVPGKVVTAPEPDRLLDHLVATPESGLEEPVRTAGWAPLLTAYREQWSQAANARDRRRLADRLGSVMIQLERFASANPDDYPGAPAISERGLKILATGCRYALEYRDEVRP